MKKIKQILTLGFMICGLSVTAQSTITGVVQDANMQDPLPGLQSLRKEPPTESLLTLMGTSH